MIRDAIFFGLWAAFCVLLTAVVFFGLLAYAVDGSAFSSIGKFALMALPTGTVAALGWRLMHRGVHQPNWLGYVVLAVGTVVVSHIVIASVLLFPRGGAKMDVIDYVAGVLLSILYHGWITVPVALAGTALFVWIRRRLSPTS